MPEDNAITEAEIGQSIVSTSKRAVFAAIRLEQDIAHSDSYYAISVLLTISAENYLESGKDNFGIFYQKSGIVSIISSALTSC